MYLTTESALLRPGEEYINLIIFHLEMPRITELSKCTDVNCLQSDVPW